jgi:acyl carrier protein
MSRDATANHPDKNTILEDLIELIREMNFGWEVQFDESIGPETFLGADLRLKSLDFVRLATAIRQRYDQKQMPFQELFVSDDGQIREDIRVSHLADFLYKHIGA